MGEFWVATKSIILYERKALILKRSNYIEIGKGNWEFAGGGLRFGEELHEGLHREIKEETGLRVTVDKLLYAITRLVSPERQIVGLTYLSHANSNEVILSEEHTEYIWATKKQLCEIIDRLVLKDLEDNEILDQLDMD